MKTRFRPLHFVGGIFLLICLPGVVVALVGSVKGIWAIPDSRNMLLAGFVAGLVLDHWVIRRFRGFHTFEHELTHALAGLLFFRSIKKFTVTRREGGLVKHSSGFGGRFGDAFILLAPYVLPTFSVVCVLLRPIVPADSVLLFDIIIGATFGFHTLSTLRETRVNWSGSSFSAAGTGESVKTDIAQSGFIFSGIYIITVTLAIHGLLFQIIIDDYSGAVRWVSNVWNASFQIVPDFIVLGGF